MFFAQRVTARRRPALGPNGSFRAKGDAPTQSTVLPSDVPNCVKRIKNRRASSRQHTLAHRRAASRSKPPKPLLHANVALPSDVLHSVKRIKNGALPLVSTPYPHP
nr:hypothetical protein [Methylomarinum sp. Ch1-1]MDP4520130.1 hypothetical protein [Methylomarinum sp. Ch1-1]